jgi:hypothetical protein
MANSPLTLMRRNVLPCWNERIFQFPHAELLAGLTRSSWLRGLGQARKLCAVRCRGCIDAPGLADYILTI